MSDATHAGPRDDGTAGGRATASGAAPVGPLPAGEVSSHGTVADGAVAADGSATGGTVLGGEVTDGTVLSAAAAGGSAAHGAPTRDATSGGVGEGLGGEMPTSLPNETGPDDFGIRKAIDHGLSRLVVVSNRVPAAGAAKAGGLAVALQALMEQRGGLWFGWSGNIADGGAHQVHTREVSGVEYATVDLTREEHERYYTGFSNTTLWPLLHSLLEYMSYERRNLQTYRMVNERMADTLAPLLRPTDFVWVHDYHLIPMAASLRHGGFRGPIGFFLHVPFPSPDILSSVPEGSALVRDLLAADLIGFQTTNDVENFAAAASRFAGASRQPGGGLLYGGRRVRLGSYPVEIDFGEFRDMAAAAWHSSETERLRRSLQGQTLIFGAERMDPTKGLPHRLAGFRRLLETRPDWRRRTTFLQIAASSRTEVEAYRELREELDMRSGAINSEWSEADWIPVRLLARGVTREAIAGYMREARVGLVTPLRDGMNLVAKEYVAAQDPQDPGVLVLSRFAGAARQLGAALLVNPYDADEMADALHVALRMTRPERQDRWKTLSKALADTSTLGWGRSFVTALTRTGAAAPSARVLHAPAGME